MNVKLENIGYCFNGKNQVLSDVSFEIKGGEITALLGENGAGKSTLMNILGGILPVQSGKIFIDGIETVFNSPNDSLASGIGFVHQELNLIEDLTVYENMFISGFLKKGLFLDKKEMIKRTSEIFKSLNVDIDPCLKVGELGVSYKQIVEICKVLLQDAKLLIMDEPTSSLTGTEIERVFCIMRTLREKGVGIVFISHKLNEVMEICDTYSILRNGVLVESGNLSDTTVKGISEQLVGHSLEDIHRRTGMKYGNEVLRLEHFSDGKHFRDISMSVKEGQILGVTGLLGDGRSEIFSTVFTGENRKYKGKIKYFGKEIKPSGTKKSVNMNIAYLSANRKETGILKDLSVMDNSTIVKLPKLKKGNVLIDEKSVENEFLTQKKELAIKADYETDPITSISGGNQQKILLGKWLMTNPKLLILDNPTQGVDVGAKNEIYSIIRKAADTGMAVIWLSPEANEIVLNCDDAYVLFHGKIAGYLTGEALNEKEIMNLATGGKKKDE